MALVVVAYNLDIPKDFHIYGVNTIALTKFFPPTRAFEFFMGCITAYLLNFKREIRSSCLNNSLVLCGIFCILLAGFNLFSGLKSSVPLIFFFTIRALIISVGIFLCTYKVTVFPQKLSLFLGQISFQIFMVHQVIERLFRIYNFYPFPSQICNFLLYVGVVFIVSVGVYYSFKNRFVVI